MSDDMCRPHSHFGNSEHGADSMTCHHFYPRDGAWRCNCGAVRDSVVSRDVGRKYKDRMHNG